MTDTLTPVEEVEDFGEGKDALVSRWMTEIKVAQKENEAHGMDWFKTGDEIVKRYRDERDESQNNTVQRKDSKFNILWANVELLQPALYSRTPVPEVVRRFKERDPVARAAATLQERAISYTLDTQDFDDVMTAVVKDRLLPGRGTLWVRYVPTLEDVTPQIGVMREEAFDDFGMAIEVPYQDEEGNTYTDDLIKTAEDGSMYVDGETYEEVTEEKTIVDYVYWKDFSHNPARNWGEVRWVSRRTYMTRTQLRERFDKKIADAVPLDFTPKNISNDDEIGTAHNETFKKATVYEVWDKTEKKAYWFAEKYEHGPLDQQDDPLGLENFFPCPKPIYATTTTDTMIPVPDYSEYQDQANELDALTSRMKNLMKALKLSGVYNAAIKGQLQDILSKSENTLVAVDNWAMFAEKGGMKGNVDWVPVQEVAAVLLSVVQTREQVKRDLYEITGLSDVMRGSSDPNETLGAQEMKGQYGTLRLKNSIAEVQRMARDTLRIIGEIIAEMYSPETIREIAGMEMPTRAEVQQAQAMLKEMEGREEKIKELPPEQQAQAQKIPGPSKSEMDDIRDMANDVAFEDAIELLQDQGARTFRLDIETNSTIAADEQNDRKDRIEFLNTASSFMKMSAELGGTVPEFVPALGEMFMFALRGFKVGRQLEDSFEEAIEAIQRKHDQQADNPQPDPQLVLLQREADREDRKLDLEEKLVQGKVMNEADKNQITALDDKTGHEVDREQLRVEKDLKERELAQDFVNETVRSFGG